MQEFNPLSVLIQVGNNLFSIEDCLLQRAVLIFDHSIGILMPECENSLLVYHLVAAVYLTLKVENRAAKLNFNQF